MPHTSRPSLLCTSTGLLDPDDLNSSSHQLYPNSSVFSLNRSQQIEDETDGPGEVTSGPLENTSGALDLTSASLEPGDLTPTPLHPGDLLSSTNEASARLMLPPTSTRTSVCSSATSLATVESYTSCASRVESSEDEVLLFIYFASCALTKYVKRSCMHFSNFFVKVHGDMQGLIMEASNLGDHDHDSSSGRYSCFLFYTLLNVGRALLSQWYF